MQVSDKVGHFKTIGLTLMHDNYSSYYSARPNNETNQNFSRKQRPA
jgi:hypothetical protein